MADPTDLADLNDAELERRLARLDELLEQLDRTPGVTAALAMEAVQVLTEIHGVALARVVRLAPAQLLEEIGRDELVRHLLVLHGLHPDCVEERVERALADVRPYLHSHGGDVSLVSVTDGVATVAFTGHCDGCTSSTATMEAVIRDAVFALAPELDRVDAQPATAPSHAAPVIPIDSLLRRPVSTA